jgi:DNA-binding MarR family transcriptional regulator
VANRAPSLVNPRLSAAMSHPTRVHALTTFLEREASPKEIAAELEEPVNNVTYHVKQLVDLGWIELTRAVPTHGGRVVEHFYRAIRRAYLDEDEWNQLGSTERQILISKIMHHISLDINEAILAGTFCNPDDNHLTRTPLVVDPSGWEEVKEVLNGALLELMEIRKNVAGRAASSDEPTMSVKVEMIQVRSPDKKRPTS